MEPNPAAVDIQNSSVPVKTALNKITNWKEAFRRVVSKEKGSIPDFIPQAVFIPIPDIKALADKYSDKYGLKVAGVRAYFALDTPFFENKIRLMLVPVVETTTNYVPAYRDLIVVHEVQAPVELVETSIYDFTKPCPDFCDTESILYNADVPVTKL